MFQIAKTTSNSTLLSLYHRSSILLTIQYRRDITVFRPRISAFYERQSVVNLDAFVISSPGDRGLTIDRTAIERGTPIFRLASVRTERQGLTEDPSYDTLHDSQILCTAACSPFRLLPGRAVIALVHVLR